MGMYTRPVPPQNEECDVMSHQAPFIFSHDAGDLKPTWRYYRCLTALSSKGVVDRPGIAC